MAAFDEVTSSPREDEGLRRLHTDTEKRLGEELAAARKVPEQASHADSVEAAGVLLSQTDGLDHFGPSSRRSRSRSRLRRSSSQRQRVISSHLSAGIGMLGHTHTHSARPRRHSATQSPFALTPAAVKELRRSAREHNTLISAWATEGKPVTTRSAVTSSSTAARSHGSAPFHPFTAAPSRTRSRSRSRSASRSRRSVSATRTRAILRAADAVASPQPPHSHTHSLSGKAKAKRPDRKAKPHSQSERKRILTSLQV